MLSEFLCWFSFIYYFYSLNLLILCMKVMKGGLNEFNFTNVVFFCEIGLRYLDELDMKLVNTCVRLIVLFLI